MWYELDARSHLFAVLAIVVAVFILFEVWFIG